jgi:hypothetical protein
MESVLESALESTILQKKFKNHGLLEFPTDPPLGGGLDANSGRPYTLIHSLPCRTPCRLFIHGIFLGL